VDEAVFVLEVLLINNTNLSKTPIKRLTHWLTKTLALKQPKN